MGPDSIPLWIVFALCVIGGAYFAATESAFSAVNKIKIKTLADDGSKRARGVLYVLNHFEKALSTLLVGNNVTKIAAASVATVLATEIFRDRTDVNSFAFSLACSAATTAVIFLLSEMIPKSFANDRAQSVSLFFQRSLRVLMRVLSPIASFFTVISNAVTRLFSKTEEAPSFTEEEFKEILDTVEEEGVVDEEQGDMLKSALEFGDTVVGDIMTMARDIEMLDAAATSEQVLAFIREAKHSRIPVYAGNPDRVIGTLRIRTFLTEYRRNPGVKLRSLLSAPRFVREDAKIGDVLTDMRQHKHHIALVRDEKRKILGLVTIEDILEELVGEIFDEEDIVDRNFQALGGDKYLVNTRLLMGTLYERAGLYKSPRGLVSKPMISFILETLGRMPAQDESFLYDHLEITVDSIEDGKPTYVVVHFLDDEELAARTAPAEEGEVDA